MEYNIPAKPTRYKGRLYRSRLEARWAAFFDSVGWEYEYEPTEINGRNPDFFIKCTSNSYDCSTLIIEVKPSPFLTKEYIESAFLAYYDYPAHILFLTESPFYFDNNDTLCIGVGSQYLGEKSPENKHCSVEDIQMKDINDFGSSYMLFDGMIYGTVERKKWLDKNWSSLEIRTLLFYWAEAANEVMFLKP